MDKVRNPDQELQLEMPKCQLCVADNLAPGMSTSLGRSFTQLPI